MQTKRSYRSDNSARKHLVTRLLLLNPVHIVWLLALLLLLIATPVSASFLTFVEMQKDGVNGVDGLNGTFSVTVSPDGAHVYAAGTFDDAIAAFSRNATTGALTFVEVKKDGVDGVDGLNGAYSVAVSPDGAHVYAASTIDNAVAVFSRNATTGALTFVEVKKDGVDGVDGLANAVSVTVSPNGASVYVAGLNDQAVAVFSRNAATGALTFVEVVKDNVGGVDGIQQPTSVTVSPDNMHVYTTGIALNDGLAVFSRNTTTGELTFVELKRDGVGGVDGLSLARSVVVSPNGQHVYVAAQADSAVAVFSRNTTTGALTFVEAKKDGIGGVDGLFGAFSVKVSPDDQDVYVAGSSDNAVAAFSRNPTTGALTFVEMEKDGIGGVDGLDHIQSVAVSPDSNHVYTGSQLDDAVAVFSASDAPPPSTDTPTATHTSTPTPGTPTATPTPTPAEVHLPLVVRDFSSIATPTDTPTPGTPTPTDTYTPTPGTPTPTDTPTPIVLPPSITRVVFGTSFNNGTDCEIVDPLPQPVTYPTGTVQIAFQVVFDVSQFQTFSASITPGFGVTTLIQNCNKYVVYQGQVRQSQLGATISRPGGLPLPPNTYTLNVSTNGHPTVHIPFEIR